MRLIKFLILSLSFSACGSAPLIDVCVIDNNEKLICVRPDHTRYVKDVDAALNYVCMSPNDSQVLFTYISEKCSK